MTDVFEFKILKLEDAKKKQDAFAVAAEFLTRASAGPEGVDGAIAWWKTKEQKDTIVDEKKPFVFGTTPVVLQPTHAKDAKKKLEEKKTEKESVEVVLKNLLERLTTLNTEPLQQANAVIQIENNDSLKKLPYMRILLEVMNDVSNIYANDPQFNTNVLLKDALANQIERLTKNNQIQKAFTLKNRNVISVETQGDLLFLKNTINIDADFTITTLTDNAVRFALIIWFMLRIYFKKTSIGLTQALLSKQNDFNKDKSMIFYKAFVDALFTAAKKLKFEDVKPKKTMKQIQNDLEMVESIEKYFNSASKKYNVDKVYKHLLSPLNTVFNDYKTDIDDKKGLDALQRLVNVGIFQRFPDNPTLQTRYLHSMSIAANMLESHIVNGFIDPSDVERSYIEWPFEIAPGTTFDV
ncbi:MAG: hypothetical protein K2Q45_05280 [Nitrosomonas sp.]|nr:hypothetical protein [Nitrosomonas sp.]